MDDDSRHRILKLTGGSLRNNYITISKIRDFFPSESFGGKTDLNKGKEFTVFTDIGFVFQTDIRLGSRLRKRPGKFFKKRFVIGDTIHIYKINEHTYFLSKNENSYEEILNFINSKNETNSACLQEIEPAQTNKIIDKESSEKNELQEIFDDTWDLINLVSNKPITDKKTSDKIIERFRKNIVKLTDKPYSCDEKLEIFTIPDYYNKKLPEQITSDMSITGLFRGIEDLYVQLYFLNFQRLLEINQFIALSFFSIIEEEDQLQNIDDLNLAFFGELGNFLMLLEGKSFKSCSMDDDDAESFNLRYHIILKRLELIEKLLNRKMISEAFVIYVSVIKILSAYNYFHGISMLSDHDLKIIYYIKSGIMSNINSANHWVEKAEDEIKSKNKYILDLSDMNKRLKMETQQSSKKMDFSNLKDTIYKLITEINEIQKRKKQKEIFDFKQIVANNLKIVLASNEYGWDSFVLGLYNIFYDGTGQGKNIPDFFKERISNDKMIFKDDFIIMDIKHLRNEQGHAKTKNSARLTKIYQNYTSKIHFSLLSEEEITRFQKQVLNNIKIFLQDLKELLGQ